MVARFITGGLGFIGSNYLNIMVNKYLYDLFVCLDTNTYVAVNVNIKDIDINNLFMDTNVNGVRNLSDLYLKYKVKRFHQVSIDEVYCD